MADATTDRELDRDELDRDTPGWRFRMARSRSGLSQGQLAARLRCRASYVSDLECGRRHATLEWLWDAALAMSVNPADLDDRLAER